MAAAGIAAFLGLDQAIDQAGVQLPATLTGLRQVLDPLTGNLAWLIGNRWAFGLIGCIGLFVLAGWLRRRLTARYVSFRTA